MQSIPPIYIRYIKVVKFRLTDSVNIIYIFLTYIYGQTKRWSNYNYTVEKREDTKCLYNLDNYFSARYGVDQLAARKVLRMDQLDTGNKYPI